MFGISGFELFIILLFGFLLFGPDKLPAMARTLGRGIAKFRAAQQDMSDVLKESNAFDPNAEDPFKDPTETIDKLAITAEKHLRSAGSSVKTSVKEKTHDKPATVESADASLPQVANGAAAAMGAAASVSADVASQPESAVAPNAAATAANDAASDPAAAAAKVKSESFTERKARYERERAARLAAEKEAAQKAAEGGETACQ